MKTFKDFLDKDIEDFKKLNVGIIKNSKDELVRKIEEKYGIPNDAMKIISDLNRLLGKKKFGFTFRSLESSKIDEEIKLNKKKIETIKMKFFQSNSSLSEMKRELEKKLSEATKNIEKEIQNWLDLPADNIIYNGKDITRFKFPADSLIDLVKTERDTVSLTKSTIEGTIGIQLYKKGNKILIDKI